ncbi:hypothetical protein TNIN_190071 [Trichonephila inaurata madagascariensis]|uniref:Uncharacterized protein n=1 Tax=Trichonephila inaurata madagascariensis TaxID=2747483 RepID=A0A8X6IAV6_9ARAC|nr:hypothetical protein TNIN_190071 [Trichonephila inaurata madagascariensis]
MDIWRNERLVFETLPSGDVKCSVDKGTVEDKFGLIQIAKKAERRIQMKKKKAQTVKNTQIEDTRMGEKANALLHRPFESLQWSMAPNEVEKPPSYTMMKAFKLNLTSLGFLKISPFSIKELQYSPLDNLHFVLMKGHLEVVIQNTTFILTAGDTWMPWVPLIRSKIVRDREHIALLYGIQKPLLTASVRRITQMQTDVKYSFVCF